ncbi:hypothetical protein ZIOFF_066003 [Zingiber officinale]|uniref:RRM domain-containing protein n=1 Tax=Zingiber officinale TaxID=94328 RepID=A0A8J5EXR1_ZINOF|nr:hypothetical protein ZIOFF_066003 [Zingiber officinale]
MVGFLGTYANKDRLGKYFSNNGKVVEAVIIKDRNTGCARGFAFIVFADPAVAERVVMEKHMIDGRMVEAKKVVPRDEHQILNRNASSGHGSPGPDRTEKKICWWPAITENEFKKYFDQFGTIIDVVVMYDHNTQWSRGFGFITYESEDAVDNVLCKTFHELNGKIVEVKRVVPKELSPRPNMRSPTGVYNYGLNQTNNFLIGLTKGHNPSSFGGYGMRMDNRLGLASSARDEFSTSSPSFGMGMNFEPSLVPSIGGNSSFGNNIRYGRGLSPYYSGSSARFNSPIGYVGVSASSNAYMPLGSDNLGEFNNNNPSWDSTAPFLSQIGMNSSSYAGQTLSYRGSYNFDLGPAGFVRNHMPNPLKPSCATTNGGFEETSQKLYGGSSVYGDPTWQSSLSGHGEADPFGYALDNVLQISLAWVLHNNSVIMALPIDNQIEELLHKMIFSQHLRPSIDHETITSHQLCWFAEKKETELNMEKNCTAELNAAQKAGKKGYSSVFAATLAAVLSQRAELETYN